MSQLLLPTAGYFWNAVLCGLDFVFFFDGPEYTGGIRWKNIRYQKKNTLKEWKIAISLKYGKMECKF